MLVTHSDRIFTLSQKRSHSTIRDNQKAIAKRVKRLRSPLALPKRRMVRKQQSADRTSYRKCDRSPLAIIHF